jgi:hypothetical protein
MFEKISYFYNKYFFKKRSKYNGILNILWHNTSFCKSNYPGWDSFYLNIFKVARKYSYYNKPVIDILREWEKQLAEK